MSQAPASKAAKTRSTIYDVAEQLCRPEACLDARPADAPEDIAGVIRAPGYIAGVEGMAQVTEDTGRNFESLYQARGVEGHSKFATLLKVAKALGVRLHAQDAASET